MSVRVARLLYIRGSKFWVFSSVRIWWCFICEVWFDWGGECELSALWCCWTEFDMLRFGVWVWGFLQGQLGLSGPSFGAGHSATLNAGQSLSVMSNAQTRRVVVAKVASAETPEAAEEAPAAPAITTILSEADLLKKKAKREELRRKRLVRKRKLRKKGKWPPSKMAKLKNV